VTIITTELLGPVPEGVAEVLIRPYAPGDLEGFLFVVAATADGEVNDLIEAEARERATLINVVDDLSRGDTYFAALHRQGEVVVAVSTSGSAPALAQYVRNLIAEALPEYLGETAALLKAEREALHQAGASTEHRSWDASIAAALRAGAQVHAEGNNLRSGEEAL
ncbi:MAG: NAD(P)-dependent oxidoreductase, partial [Actinomycetota bacterium]